MSVEVHRSSFVLGKPQRLDGDHLQTVSPAYLQNFSMFAPLVSDRLPRPCRQCLSLKPQCDDLLLEVLSPAGPVG